MQQMSGRKAGPSARAHTHVRQHKQTCTSNQNSHHHSAAATHSTAAQSCEQLQTSNTYQTSRAAAADESESGPKAGHPLQAPAIHMQTAHTLLIPSVPSSAHTRTHRQAAATKTVASAIARGNTTPRVRVGCDDTSIRPHASSLLRRLDDAPGFCFFCSALLASSDPAAGKYTRRKS